MDYYPDYEDENASCCSAEIEGGVAVVGPIKANNDPQNGDKTYPPNEVSSANVNISISDVNVGRHDSGDPSTDNERSLPVAPSSAAAVAAMSAVDGNSITAQNEQTENLTAILIQNERTRRLGIRGTAGNATTKNSLPRSRSSSAIAVAANPGAGVLDNIIGWFGGGGLAESTSSQKPPTAPLQSSMSAVDAIPCHRSSSTADSHVYTNLHRKGSSEQRGRDHPPQLEKDRNIPYIEEDEDYSSTSSDGSSGDDSDSASQFSNTSNNKHLGGSADLNPQERARVRALRYLSNSCVDARRRAKTASYVWGLECLDLKRKEDRYAKELEVVEAEMNKDRGLWLGNWAGEKDAVTAMAINLVRELPRIQGADAGGGIGRGKDLVLSKSFMSYEDYADAINNDTSSLNDGTHCKTSLWEKKEAVDDYVNSLHSRLKEALERIRSLERRLVVLDETGDDIISSLCEDLAEVAGDSNKAEARYVKKGKELQRKGRREEMRQRRKIKHAERHIQKLREQMMNVVEGGKADPYSDTVEDFEDSEDDDNDEYDEVLLEQKLLTIETKRKQDKKNHQSEVESVRRQCEQLKLRLSVTRLVMEGDDNLHDYIALLERLNPSTRAQQSDRGCSGIHRDNIVPPPPSRITRARAKLVKVIHLANIYEQRLSVSKAFTDATINALEQELSERENDRQKMEVKCLNDLMMIDSRIKKVMQGGSEKMAELESEAQELKDAVATLAAEKSVGNINAMFGRNDTAIEPAQLMSEELNDLSSSRSIDDEKDNDIQLEKNRQNTNTDLSHVMRLESSNKTCINEEDNDEKQMLIGQIEDEIFRRISIGEKDNDVIQLKADDTSYTESLQTEKDDPVCHSGEGVNADNIKDSHEKRDCTDHDVEGSVSYGEGRENDHNSHENPDFSFSKETQHKTNELLDPENTDGKPKATTQCNPPSECSTGLPCAEVETNDNLLAQQPSSIANRQNVQSFTMNSVTDDDQKLENSKDDKDETVSELCKTKTTAYLPHGDIVCDQNINGEDTDHKGEKNIAETKKKVVDLLGHELKCALADYQTSFDLSSSSDRIKKLNYMNSIVAKIGKVHWGIDVNSQSSSKSMLKSWSLKKLHPNSPDRKERKKKRSRRKKKKKLQRPGKERKAIEMNGPDDIVERFGKSLVW